MPWGEFDKDSALERDLLSRALPLVPTSSQGTSRATLDLATNTSKVDLSVSDVLGTTPDRCIELLGLRPLLVGAAWKVLDLLVETALDEAGVQFDARRGYTIKKKVESARRPVAGPGSIDPVAWNALMTVYANTEDLRHSLVHRRAHTDSNNALVGVDPTGKPIRPLAAVAQEAFVRSVLRASDLATSAVDERAHADLVHQLAALQQIHGENMQSVQVPAAVPEITVIIGDESRVNNCYQIDLDKIRDRVFKDVIYADLILKFRDRPGQDLRGRLEKAPQGIATVDPDQPPNWLR